MYKPVKQVVPSAVYTTVSVPLAPFDRWNGGFVDSVEKIRRRGSKREELKKNWQRIVLNDVISICLFRSALSLLFLFLVLLIPVSVHIWQSINLL